MRTSMHPEELSKLLPDGTAAGCCVEFGGDSHEEATTRPQARSRADARKHERAADEIKLVDDPGGAAALWKVREGGLGATAFRPAPAGQLGRLGGLGRPARAGRRLPARLPQAVRAQYGYDGALYGHFGQGCIHCRDRFRPAHARRSREVPRLLDEAADLVVSYGGSLSGEHGDGQAQAELLPKMYGRSYRGVPRVQGIWDPDWQDEPGQGRRPLPARRRISGSAPDYNPPRPQTSFRLPGGTRLRARGHALRRRRRVPAARRART